LWVEKLENIYATPAKGMRRLLRFTDETQLRRTIETATVIMEADFCGLENRQPDGPSGIREGRERVGIEPLGTLILRKLLIPKRQTPEKMQKR
jgi:hypothetical protein